MSSRPLPCFALSKIDIGSGGGVVLGGGCGTGCSPTLLFRWLGACVPTPRRLREEGVRAGRGFTQKLAGTSAGMVMMLDMKSPLRSREPKRCNFLCRRDGLRSLLLEPKYSAIHPKHSAMLEPLHWASSSSGAQHFGSARMGIATAAQLPS